MRRRRRHAVVVDAEPIEVELTDAAFGGEALGHLPDGRVVFVPGALPGESALVQVVEERRDFARAEVVQVLRPAADRVDPPCPHFKTGCGGCSWQHADYPLQLAFKRSIVVDQLRRLGHFATADTLVQPTIGMLDPWFYRNQARFTVGRRFGELCFTYRATHRLLRIDQCWIVHPRLNEVLNALQGTLAGVERPIHQVSIRVGANTGDLMITPALPEVPQVETGQPFLEEELLGRRFRLQPPSFFQVNTRREQRPPPGLRTAPKTRLPDAGLSMADILALLVMDRLDLQGHELVVDAYCGVGTFALLLAPLAREIIGIEEARSAVRDAAHNGRDVPNVSFVEGKTEQILPTLERRPDAVVLDPSRVGAHPAVLDALLALSVPRLVYVSCDPATLARDLRILADGGYTLEDVQPLDMFPQTYHVECVATLTWNPQLDQHGS